MPWTVMDAPESVRELPEDQRAVWVRVANDALESGYDDGSAIAIAWTAVKNMQAWEWEPSVIMDYPLARPGVYTAAVGGEFEVKPEDVAMLAAAIRKLYDLGKPVAIINGHGSGDYCGFIAGCRVENDVLRGALVLRDWYMYTGIDTGAFGLSMEANVDYASDAYTDGETYPYWPTAWAVLPAGEQPAIPPGEPIAAAEAPRPVRLYAADKPAPDGGNGPTGKGDDGMDELKEKLAQLEAAQQEQAEKIAALETERDGLKDQLTAAEQERDQLKAEKQAAELEAEEAAVMEGLNAVMAAAVPGLRERMQERISAAENLETRKALLSAWEPLADKDDLAKARLQARESKPAPEQKDEVTRTMEAAEALSKSKGIPYVKALEQVNRKDEE